MTKEARFCPLPNYNGGGLIHAGTRRTNLSRISSPMRFFSLDIVTLSG